MLSEPTILKHALKKKLRMKKKIANKMDEKQKSPIKNNNRGLRKVLDEKQKPWMKNRSRG